ncbi:hypothetical protein FIU87_21025 [Bacillus sp. THAF10]|uniref:hypothetical protein n=1 Tax=Bacillus sp. THAF10 TaxID=2587848 RepID=UPI001267F828|nr:hypothetical protein [Bacillus sp. THAF10]QFT91137.1 hypothetical protein FIU87_21025 [Bacillus sp. THAF10]
MLKKLFALFTILMLTFSIVPSGFAKGNDTNKHPEFSFNTGNDRKIDSFESKGNIVYKIENTLEEQMNFISKNNLPNDLKNENATQTLTKTEEKAFMQKLGITGYKINHVETGKNENGEDYIATYYTPIYTTEKDNLLYSNLVNTNSFDPGEGALRIYMTFENLYYDHQFDSVRGLKSTLERESYSKTFSFISGQVTSNKVWISVLSTFFTGGVAAAIDQWALGDGKASSWIREAYKNGQVYTGGKWKTYFTSNQHEVYWSHKQFAYDRYSGQQLATTDFNYLPANGYLPFEWVPQVNFSNNTYILNVAQNQYKAGRGPLQDNGYPNTYYTSNWKQKGSGRNY